MIKWMLFFFLFGLASQCSNPQCERHLMIISFGIRLFFYLKNTKSAVAYKNKVTTREHSHRRKQTHRWLCLTLLSCLSDDLPKPKNADMLHKGVESMTEYSAYDERDDGRRWRVFRIGEQDHRVDMRTIEPYKRVICHGG